MTAAAADVPGTPGRAAGGALAALKHRDFAIFFSAALCSNTGTWMQTITVPFVLDELTHSTVWVGMGAFATFFPATIVGPLAGALADRYDRRTIMLSSQVLLMASAPRALGHLGDGRRHPAVDRGLRRGGCVRRGHHHRGLAGVRPAARAAGGARERGAPERACSSPAPVHSAPRSRGWCWPSSDPAPRSWPTRCRSSLVIGALLLIAPRPIAKSTDGRGSGRRSSATGCGTSASAPCSSCRCSGALFSSLLGVSMIQLAEPFARQVLHEGAGKYGLLVAAYGVGAITGAVVTVTAATCCGARR